jgi:hypothetical protein
MTLNFISQKKSLVMKTFNFLTNILNNPEECIVSDLEHYMMNATLFLGGIMVQKGDLLQNLA